MKKKIQLTLLHKLVKYLIEYYSTNEYTSTASINWSRARKEFSNFKPIRNDVPCVENLQVTESHIYKALNKNYIAINELTYKWKM